MSGQEGKQLFSRTQKIIILSLVCTLAISLFVLRHRRHMSASDVRIITGDPSAYAFRVDLNTAPWQEIALVPGLGESKAKAIVQDREKKGVFESLEDLTRVPGIGEKTVREISGYVRCQTQ